MRQSQVRKLYYQRFQTLKYSIKNDCSAFLSIEQKGVTMFVAKEVIMKKNDAD